MRKWLLFFIFILSIVQWTSAQDRGKGIGVIFGEPSGISLKFWQSSGRAIDGGVAWSFGKNNKFHFHIDYLVHNLEILKEKNLVFYYGPGLRMRMGDQDRIGIRTAFGVNYYFKEFSLDAFLEMVPILDLIPGTYLNFNAGIGFRYFFK